MLEGRKRKEERESGSLEVGKINFHITSSVLFADKEMAR